MRHGADCSIYNVGMSTGDRPWLRHYEAGVPAEIVVPDGTLTDMLRTTARDHPDRDAVVCYGRTSTYAQLGVTAGRVAALLMQAGVRPGDRVALLFPNVPDVVSAYYGALWAGAVVVQLNPLGTDKDIAHALRDSGATVLIALDALAGKFMAGLREAAVKTVFISNIADVLPLPLKLGFKLKALLGKVPLPPKGFGENFADRLAAITAPAEPAPRTATDLALLQYTGGTTGMPKAAMLTHRNLVANTEQCKAWIGERPPASDVCLLVVPCFHVYGMTVGMNLSVRGAQTMILLPRWEPLAAMKAIAKYKPTQFPGVQVFYQAIASHPKVKDYDLKSVEICLSGAGPLMQEVQEKFEGITGARLIEGYGLTEASPVTHANPIHGQRKPGIGLPFSSTDVKLVDIATGTKDVGAGEPGELCVKGPQVMQGYWNREQDTKDVLRDGWLHTGDIATMDDEGYFRIVDRKKEMIKSGGENVYPRDVEEALFAHPAVGDAGVIGVPDQKFGEMVKAFVVKKPGATVTEQDLIAHCRKTLSGFATPKAIVFKDALPRTQVGKLLRRVLAEEDRAAAK